jgi:hypothetical protein
LSGSDPGRQVASLREVLLLVRTISGSAAVRDPDALLDEAARVSSAYARTSPVNQRRFDAQAAEIAAWAAAGVEALLSAGDPPPPAPAARLAQAIEDHLARLNRLLRL